jgi:hypothetical protein
LDVDGRSETVTFTNTDGSLAPGDSHVWGAFGGAWAHPVLPAGRAVVIAQTDYYWCDLSAPHPESYAPSIKVSVYDMTDLM